MSTTPRQQEILNYINDYISLHGVRPTMREMMTALDIDFVQSLKNQLNKLIASGALPEAQPSWKKMLKSARRRTNQLTVSLVKESA